MSIEIFTILAAVWFACAVVNMVWLKYYPDVMAVEWRPILIWVSPLSTACIAIGFGYYGLSHAAQFVAGKNYETL